MVIAPDPALSQDWSERLIAYAEEQVDHLTQRLREDQMAGALGSYEAAEARRAEALADWLTDPAGGAADRPDRRDRGPDPADLARSRPSASS